MMDVSIRIKKAEVYDEVAKLTAYVGSKTTEDSGLTYDRVFTTDDDREMLERLWRECLSDMTDIFNRYVATAELPVVSQEVDIDEVFTLSLTAPSNYNTLLTSHIENNLRSYCINQITAKWFMITNKAEAEYYSTVATGNLTDAKNKFYHRIKPTRRDI